MLLTFSCRTQTSDFSIKYEYYSDGKIKSITTYRARKKEGSQLQFYKNQIIKSDEYYKNGKKDGISKFYYSSGDIKEIANYKNDQLNGRRVLYLEDSVFIDRIENYKNGTLDSYSKYFHDAYIEKSYEVKDRKEIQTYNWKEDENFNRIKKNIEICNNHYIVYLLDKRSISLIDVLSKKQEVLKTEYPIQSIETCKSFPFICYSIYKGVERELIFVNLENKQNFSINEFEGFPAETKHWSDDGEMTFINEKGKLLLIETKNFSQYFEGRSAPVYLEVTGSFLEISQHCWVGNFLIYRAGRSYTDYCFGMIDIEKKKNYLISCCDRYNRNNETIDCDEVFEIEYNRYYDFIGDAIAKQKMQEIGFDFLREVLRIRPEKWGIRTDLLLREMNPPKRPRPKEK